MLFSQYLKVGKLYRPNGVADITYLWYKYSISVTIGFAFFITGSLTG